MSQDASRLEQSKVQLSNDKQTLSATRQQSDQASAPALKAAPAVNLNSAIENPPPVQQTPKADVAPKPQINAQGQTIGTLINVTA